MARMAREAMLIWSNADMVEKVRINGARKVIKWIEKRIRSQLNFLGDRMEMMILKGHGEGQIFKNIVESDRMMFSYERNDIKARVFLERKKARLSRHDGRV